MSRNTKKRTKSQSQLFIEKARELGCDEDEAAFEDQLKRIARAPSPKDQKPKREAKRKAK